MTRILSKSKFLIGQQCAKLLWTHYNAKKELPAPDDATQAIFDQGHVVGALAQTLFPGGIEIAGDPKDIEGALRKTREQLSRRVPLFEPAFQHGSAFARADILNPVARGAWDIVEVKSSTSVKEVNILDLALQRYTYEGAGLKIRKCILMHIDKEYVRKGEIEADKLLIQQDVTDEVAEVLPRVAGELAAMVKVIARKNVPEVAIGPHCDDPYECPLKERCWEFLPEENPLTLYRIRKEKAFELIERGIITIKRLPRDVTLNDKQRIQVGSAQKGRPFADAKAIGAFLDTLVHPLWFLDFETIAPGVPLFDASRPFQNIPFQFSLHVQESPGAAPRHISFLAEGRDDPRPRFLEELRSALGERGSIVTYNAGFELGRLDELTTLFPRHRAWYRGVAKRTVDLLGPFREFSYYHPRQHGSASIKAVLPALTGEGYDGMEIADGGTASREYLRVTFGEADAKERRRVYKALVEYCGLDTLAMVRIVERLSALSARK